MEFLLINHPLDCPICDQGGECQLQDLAVGYGGSASRYQEEKRVVVNKNLGPLISTDMTRCIHCTRCVRFGQEVAGIMELGMAGRGEHSEILTFVAPHGGLRALGQRDRPLPRGRAHLEAVPLHGAHLGALAPQVRERRTIRSAPNLVVQTKQERVMRVLPLENEAVNECWISDRDRFAYEGLNAEDRLRARWSSAPARWAEVDWPEALDAAAQGLEGRRRAQRRRRARRAASRPTLTLEELHLGAAARARPGQRQHRPSRAPVGLPRQGRGRAVARHGDRGARRS